MRHNSARSSHDPLPWPFPSLSRCSRASSAPIRRRPQPCVNLVFIHICIHNSGSEREGLRSISCCSRLVRQIKSSREIIAISLKDSHIITLYSQLRPMPIGWIGVSRWHPGLISRSIVFHNKIENACIRTQCRWNTCPGRFCSKIKKVVLGPLYCSPKRHML